MGGERGVMNALEALTRLARRLAAARALALALAALAALAGMLALAALAARAGLLSAVRWTPLALWVLALAGFVAVVRELWRRLAASDSIALRRTAALVEHELALRRGTFVGLVDLAGGAPEGTSAAFVAAAAARLERALPADPQRTWAPATARALAATLRARLALAAGAALAAALSLWSAGEAAAVLVSPLRALRAAVAPRVSVSASPAAVRAGAGVRITVVTEPRAARATLFVRATGEPWRRLDLTPDASGHAVRALEDLRVATFVYAAASGAVSDTLTVHVLQPLALGDFRLTARFPTYLRRGDEELDPGAGPFALPVGTALALRGSASATLLRASLATGADTVRLQEHGASFEGQLVVRGSATWRLVLVGEGGATLSEPVPAVDVVAVPDSAPVVTVPVPGADTTAPLDLRPAVVVDARDDHALGRVEILSWRKGRLGTVGDTVVDTLAGVAGADRIVLSHVLDLTSRGLLPGDTLRFIVRASDQAPVPHVGFSREYALRLRSMAELREAVRTGSDSLSREAAALATDQTAVTRQTEDLAAQRARANERAERPADPRAAQAPRPDDASASPSGEQAAEAQRILEDQESLVQRAESLRTALERLAQAAQDAGINDPGFQQQLRDLEQLLRQAMTPEMQRRLEELRAALQNVDARAVQEALRRLAEQQRNLRESLQRSAELFERAAIEGMLQTAAAQAEALQQQQEAWAQGAEGRQDSASAAREEQALRSQTDSLSHNVEEAARRLGERGDTAASRALQRASEQLGQASQGMQRASQSMTQGQRAEASRQGAQAAQDMEGVSQSLRETQRQVSSGWRSEVLERLGRSMQETVTLALEEQRLARELRQGAAGSQTARGRQSSVEQGITQIQRSLQEAAGRNALVSPRLGSQLARARELVGQSREALEGTSPDADESSRRAQEASQALSAAAMQMLQNSQQIANSQSGSGLAEAIEQLGQLANAQGQLNDELSGMLPLLGSGNEAVLRQLRMLAERQRQLANRLERLGEQNIPGRPEQLAEEARRLADRIQQGQLDRTTLERQQRLFRRMLDAGRSLRNDEEPEDPERKSRTAQDMPARAAPGAVPREGALRYPPPSWDDLRALTPADRAMVLDYFRRLNATPR
jgi:hypothetical protein